MRSRQRSKAKSAKRLILIIFLLLVGMRGGGWALTSDVPLQVEGDRLTGHLSQVTLRTVLEQLKKQLGVAYEAPVGELDKVISVDLQQSPILPALAKILAPWDYAFTVNAAGHLQFLYVTPKAPPAEAVPETSAPSPGRGALAADPLLSHDREPDPILPPSSSAVASPHGDFPELRAPVADVHMGIKPVPAGTTMPMVPPSGGGGMQVTPTTNPPNMPVIPATAYPPMDIQPVPGYLQEEMLRNIQP